MKPAFATAAGLLKLSIDTLIEPSTMNRVALGSPFGPGPWRVSWWTDRWAAARIWKIRLASTDPVM